MKLTSLFTPAAMTTLLLWILATGAPLSAADDEREIERALEVYGRLLDEAVTPDGLVRYEVLRRGDRRRALDEITLVFARADLPVDKDERLAFWCNAYNGNVLRLVLEAMERPDFRSVSEVKGFFDEQTIVVGGEGMTLNDLENARIRPLKDPRIHAALVCAAVSCPPLRNEVYRADHLNRQLDDQCRRWINDMTKFRMVEGKAGFSEILKWYGEDFAGEPFASAAAFVGRYADPSSELGSYLDSAPEPLITFIAYDWTLNQARSGEDIGD